MKQLCLSLLIAVAFTTTGRATTYTDWWADATVAGSSVNIAQQGDVLFFAWYLYGEDNKAKWIYGVGTIAENRADVDLLEASGPFLGPASKVVSTKVGTATFAFLSAGALQFQYATATAGSGILNLKRFSFQALPLTGYYRGSYVANRYNCPLASQNGIVSSGTIYLNVSTNQNVMTIHKYDGSSVCIYSGNFTQHGSRFQVASGTYSCDSGSSGSWSAPDGLVDSGRLVVDMRVHINGGCESHSYFFGVLNNKL